MDDRSNDDVVIEVKLPIRDYRILRDLIEERQAMSGLKKWINNRLFWFGGGLLTFIGVFEFFRNLK